MISETLREEYSPEPVAICRECDGETHTEGFLERDMRCENCQADEWVRGCRDFLDEVMNRLVPGVASDATLLSLHSVAMALRRETPERWRAP